MRGCTKADDCHYGETCLAAPRSPALVTNVTVAQHLCYCTQDLYGYQSNCIDKTWNTYAISSYLLCMAVVFLIMTVRVLRDVCGGGCLEGQGMRACVAAQADLGGVLGVYMVTVGRMVAAITTNTEASVSLRCCRWGSKTTANVGMVVTSISGLASALLLAVMVLFNIREPIFVRLEITLLVMSLLFANVTAANIAFLFLSITVSMKLASSHTYKMVLYLFNLACLVISPGIYWGLMRREVSVGIYLDCLFLIVVHSLHFFGGSHLYPYLESQSSERRSKNGQAPAQDTSLLARLAAAIRRNVVVVGTIGITTLFANILAVTFGVSIHVSIFIQLLHRLVVVGEILRFNRGSSGNQEETGRVAPDPDGGGGGGRQSDRYRRGHGGGGRNMSGKKRERQASEGSGTGGEGKKHAIYFIPLGARHYKKMLHRSSAFFAKDNMSTIKEGSQESRTSTVGNASQQSRGSTTGATNTAMGQQAFNSSGRGVEAMAMGDSMPANAPVYYNDRFHSLFRELAVASGVSVSDSDSSSSSSASVSLRGEDDSQASLSSGRSYSYSDGSSEGASLQEDRRVSQDASQEEAEVVMDGPSPVAVAVSSRINENDLEAGRQGEAEHREGRDISPSLASPIAADAAFV